MRLKKLLIILLVIVLLVLQSNSIRFDSNISYAADESTENEADRYFYKQLDTLAKNIYDGMYDMWQNGTFKTGNGDYDLTLHGKVTQDQAANTATLLDAFGAARDAFTADYPDVFYVDFSLLSIRVITDASNQKFVYLGTGRKDTYFLNGFTKNNVEKAIKDYEKALEDAISEIKKNAKDTTTKEIVFAANDYLTTNMIYKFEHEVSNSNCNARTAYDALIYGEGVCEAYTRGFKAILDRLEIPCVYVVGVYKPSKEYAEPHAWNYVKVDGKWYGVDVTHNDPTNKNWTQKKSGHETREYCLLGENQLGATHFASGIMSSANHEFDYPSLASDSIGIISYYTDDDLIVKLDEPTATFYISYKGKNYSQNVQDGYYILGRYINYATTGDIGINNKEYYTEWSYLAFDLLLKDTTPYEPKEPRADMIPEGKAGEEGYGEGYYIKYPLEQVSWAQFAVTTVPPTHSYSEDGGLSGSLFYEGELELLRVMSKEISNPNGNYIKPPYPISIDPIATTVMWIGSTYHVTITYDETLVEDSDPETKPGIRFFQIRDYIQENLTGEANTTISNFDWDGDSTVEFDFTPSKQYADDKSFYYIGLTGLVGETSSKPPVYVTYGCGYKTSFCSLGVGGFNWRIFGQPQLIAQDDLVGTHFTGIDPVTGEEKTITMSPKITHRLTLVTSDTSDLQADKMQDALEQKIRRRRYKSYIYI